MPEKDCKYMQLFSTMLNRMNDYCNLDTRLEKNKLKKIFSLLEKNKLKKRSLIRSV